jgi:response regulator RpfG family c-di-GMP phosphodiesterase
MTAIHAETIVVVDDDIAIRTYLTDVLQHQGYVCESFEDSLSALQRLSEHTQVDMLLSDIRMPGMNGMELLRTVKVVNPTLPVILLSGVCDFSSAAGAMRAGATDYLLKPAKADDILKLVTKHLDREPNQQVQLIRSALSRILQNKMLSGGSQAKHLIPIFDLLGFKRFETLQHSRRVSAFAVLIGGQMGMDAASLEALEIGALLHDVGKSGIPYNILMKPGLLDDEERRIMEMHPLLGAGLLADIPGMDLEAQIVNSHHERFDGTGYPDGLSGEDIPLGARIFSIADTLDAITADRCYRKGQGLAIARREIDLMSGSQFDPRVVAEFQSVSDEDLEHIRVQYPELDATVEPAVTH